MNQWFIYLCRKNSHYFQKLPLYKIRSLKNTMIAMILLNLFAFSVTTKDENSLLFQILNISFVIWFFFVYYTLRIIEEQKLKEEQN